MKYDQAHAIAIDLYKQLYPFCERIDIAGSIRRQKPEVKDIEIVCIPKYALEDDIASDLFGQKVCDISRPVVCKGFIHTVNQWKKMKGEPTGKYTQRMVPLAALLSPPGEGREGEAREGRRGEVALDLFIANKDNYGYIHMLRTGSSDWNQSTMLPRLKGNGYKLKDGNIWWKGEILPMPTEDEMFKRMGLQFIEPKDRK